MMPLFYVLWLKSIFDWDIFLMDVLRKIVRKKESSRGWDWLNFLRTNATTIALCRRAMSQFENEFILNG